MYKRKIDIVNKIMLFCTFSVLNLICMSLILYLRKQNLLVIDANMNNIGFLLKYLLISLFVAVVLPIIFYRFKKMKINILIRKE